MTKKKKITKTITIKAKPQGYWVNEENVRKGERVITSKIDKKTNTTKKLVKRNRSRYDKTFTGYEQTYAALKKQFQQRSVKAQQTDLALRAKDTRTAPVLTAKEFFNFTRRDVEGIDTPESKKLEFKEVWVNSKRIGKEDYLNLNDYVEIDVTKWLVSNKFLDTTTLRGKVTRITDKAIQLDGELWIPNSQIVGFPKVTTTKLSPNYKIDTKRKEQMKKVDQLVEEAGNKEVKRYQIEQEKKLSPIQLKEKIDNLEKRQKMANIRLKKEKWEKQRIETKAGIKERSEKLERLNKLYKEKKKPIKPRAKSKTTIKPKQEKPMKKVDRSKNLLGTFEKLNSKGTIYVEDNQVKMDFKGQTVIIRGASLGDKPTAFFDSFGSPLIIDGKKADGIKIDKELAKKISQESSNLKEKRTKAEYAELYDRMKKNPLPKKNKHPDDNKVQEILSKQNTRYFSGPEMDGVNLSISSQNARLRQEAQKYCNHNFDVKYSHDYTADARKKLVREVKCDKCDFEKRQHVADDLDERAFWR